MEYGPWQGGHPAGSIVQRAPHVYKVRFPQLQLQESFCDKNNPRSALLKAQDRRKELSLQHGFMKNMYRLVLDSSSGEKWYEMTLTHDRTMHFDLDDLPTATKHIWFAANSKRTCYARAKINGKSKAFHNIITSFLTVDHRDRDGLNNRRGNLRETTMSENSRNRRQSVKNTTGRTGVTLMAHGYYVARWTESAGHEKAKCFSVKKLGKAEAFNQAVAWREEMEKKYYQYTQAPNDDTTLVHQALVQAKTISKPFSCPKCAYTSPTKGLITRHVKTKHPQ
jgi:hypothetical protein